MVNLPSEFTPDYILHRGNHGDSPYKGEKELPPGIIVQENTLEAFQISPIQNGKKIAIELDVQLAGADVVVTHDSRLTRMTKGRNGKPVYECTWQELQQTPLGSKEQVELRNDLNISQAYIPALKEVLEKVDPNIAILLEIKTSGLPGFPKTPKQIQQDAEIAIRTADIIAQDPKLASRIIVQSFDHRALQAFKERLDEKLGSEKSAQFKTALLVGIDQAVPAYSNSLAKKAFGQIEKSMRNKFNPDQTDYIVSNHTPLVEVSATQQDRTVAEWTARYPSRVTAIQENGHIPIADPSALKSR